MDIKYELKSLQSLYDNKNEKVSWEIDLTNLDKKNYEEKV